MGHSTEVQLGQRFEFGENWSRFLELVDEPRIAEAEASLRDMLALDSLDGLTFLDAGSGSGLFSLAARRLGAQVTSFDYDPSSVACTQELRRRYWSGGEDGWRVEEGSVLDGDYLRSLGTFDVVYSWGVLHHTGKMWEALGNVLPPVSPGGQLFISIYNDQGRATRGWKKVKAAYNVARPGARRALVDAVWVYFKARRTAHALLEASGGRRLPPSIRGRGMDARRDLVDWVGGWPFEVATPEEVFAFCHERGFELQRMTTCGGGRGCNQFVFRRS